MRKKRIMIVDDQQAATHMWQVLLEFTGIYVVQQENQGRRALQTAREFAPDLIVLDVNMPEIDGGEVANHLTTDKDLRHTPILFLTSLVSEAEAALGKRIGGFPCVAKPATIDGFVESIEKHLTCNRKAYVQTLAEMAA